MQELAEITNAKIQAMVADGTIEQMIETHLKKTVDNCVQDAFRFNSPVTKALEDAFKDALAIDPKQLSLPSYNQFIAEVVRDQFHEYIDEQGAKHIAETLSETFPPVAATQKFSDVMQFIAKEWADEAREDDLDEIEIDQEHRDQYLDALHVTIKQPPRCGGTIQITFYNFKEEGWTIGYLRNESHRFSGAAAKAAAIPMNSVERRLYQYYARGTKFEADTEFSTIYLYG